MITPHDPTLYRNHGEEIQALTQERDKADSIDALLQEQAELDRAEQLNDLISETEKAAGKVLTVIFWLVAGVALTLAVIGLFGWAIHQAEAMPRFPEGF